MSVRILIGDMRARLKDLADASVDSCVTDPPYHLTANKKGGSGVKSVNLSSPYGRSRIGTGNGAGGFMRQKWDGGDVAFDPETWAEVLRVLKPGAHLVAFSGTRTYHRMACAIEDAGFEIRDQLAWCYGSGFPKSHDVAKGIDKIAHSVPLFDTIRDHIREWKDRRGHSNKSLNEALGLETNGCGMARHWTSTVGGQHMIPSKDQWRNLKRVLGWPDCELDSVYDAVKDGAERPVLGLHAVPCDPFGQRPDAKPGTITAPATPEAAEWQGWGTALKPAWEPICLARKPLIGTVAGNVLAHGTGALNIDGCRIETADALSFGSRQIGDGIKYNPIAPERQMPGEQSPLGRWPANIIHDGSEEVLAGFPETVPSTIGVRDPNGTMGYHGGASGLPGVISGHADAGGSAARFFYCTKTTTAERGEGNTHPTVKPVDLMRWLCRLVTPKGGTVLDPFAGSGSTLIAADAEQFDAIGCELSPDYAAIAERRVRDAAGMFAEVRAA